MPARLNHNVHLKQVRLNIAIHHTAIGRHIEHLASGNRINRASDDPARLALADGIASEVRALVEGQRNIQQTFSLLQVADGSLGEISNMIRRMQNLAMEAGSSVFNNTNRLSMNSEMAALIAEIDRVAGSTTYNGKNLLTGSNAIINQNGSSALSQAASTGVSGVRLTATREGVYLFEDSVGDGVLTLGDGVITQTVVLDELTDQGIVADGGHIVVDFDRLGVEVTLSGEGAVGSPGQYADGDLDGRTIQVDAVKEFTFQVGPTGTSNDVTAISIADMRASGPALNLNQISIVTIGDAHRALSVLQQAQETVVAERNRIGSFQNRLQLSIETTNSVMDIMIETEADIREVDLARRATELTKSQILAQVATRIAVEADTDIDRILSLLQ